MLRVLSLKKKMLRVQLCFIVWEFREKEKEGLWGKKYKEKLINLLKN